MHCPYCLADECAGRSIPRPLRTNELPVIGRTSPDEPECRPKVMECTLLVFDRGLNKRETRSYLISARKNSMYNDILMRAARRLLHESMALTLVPQKLKRWFRFFTNSVHWLVLHYYTQIITSRWGHRDSGRSFELGNASSFEEERGARLWSFPTG